MVGSEGPIHEASITSLLIMPPHAIDIPILLASQSPRRLQLLNDAGIRARQATLEVDDSDLNMAHAPVLHAALALAYFKAAAGARLNAARDCVVLGADTFVVKAGRIIGKPADAADADRIIQLLSGGNHIVLSGVAIIDCRTSRPNLRRLFVDQAQVRVGEVLETERKAYIESGDWHGKAGAYNLGERIDAGWPITYEGDPTTVMGLPMRTLLPILSSMAQLDSHDPHRIHA